MIPIPGRTASRVSLAAALVVAVGGCGLAEEIDREVNPDRAVPSTAAPSAAPGFPGGVHTDELRRARTDAVSAHGRHPHSADDPVFTTAYFADPAEVPGEFDAAGLACEGQYGLEGVAWPMGDVEEWLDDPERRKAVPAATRRIESEPSLLGASGHVLTVGRRA